MVGDTLEPLKAKCYLRGNPYDWTGKTANFLMETESGTSVVAETSTGVTAHPTQTFTADATEDRLTANDHGVALGDQIVVSTTGTLPGGLAASTRYFAVEVTPNAFGLATFPNGKAIDITSAGSGTHTFYVVGSVQFDFSSGHVATAGPHRAWFRSVSSSDKQTFPDDELGIRVDIKAFGN